MIESLLKEDDSAEEWEDAGGGEEKLTQRPPVSLGVLDFDAFETLSDCAGGLVRSEDALPRRTDVRSILDQLICPNKIETFLKN